MGAWIEIYYVWKTDDEYNVAPLVGAWIEMPVCYYLYHKSTVAPLVGAWIEILIIGGLKKWRKSLLSWERGLKCRTRRRNRGYFCRSSRGSVD